MRSKAIESEPPHPPWDRLVSPAEAERIANTSWKTFKRRHARGEITIIELSPRRRGIWLSELLRTLNKRATEQQPQSHERDKKGRFAAKMATA